MAVLSHIDKQGFQNHLNTRNSSFKTEAATPPMTKSTGQSCGVHPRPGEPGDEEYFWTRTTAGLAQIHSFLQ